MEEFTIAHQKVVEGNKNFILMVLVEDLDLDTLPNELQSYLRTYTYIDARNYEEDLEVIRKKIRYSMPGTPLVKIRQMQRDAAAQEGQEDDREMEEELENDEQSLAAEVENDIDELDTEDEILDETNEENVMIHNEDSSDDTSLLYMDFIEMHDI